jgi:hypothetical protein
MSEDIIAPVSRALVNYLGEFADNPPFSSLDRTRICISLEIMGIPRIGNRMTIHQIRLLLCFLTEETGKRHLLHHLSIKGWWRMAASKATARQIVLKKMLSKSTDIKP